jgi:hypothetical protein
MVLLKAILTLMNKAVPSTKAYRYGVRTHTSVEALYRKDAWSKGLILYRLPLSFSPYHTAAQFDA